MTEKFGAATTADEVLENIDLRNKRYLITGVSSGVGTETARALVARGAEVIGTIRNLNTVKEARAVIEAASAGKEGSLELMTLDLTSLDSVRKCADQLLSDGRKFDAIIANAGVMATPYERTQDGFEMQFGTNHLGHFLLINRIVSLIKTPGRVVSLSSNGHRGADIDLDDVNFEHTDYDRWQAYGRSKTANSLFAVEFDRRYRGQGIRACAVMPGTSMTPLMRHLSEQELEKVFGIINADRAEAGVQPLKLKSVPQMAATSVWAAVVADPDSIGGQYLENCGIAQIDNVPGIRDGVMSYALDADRARLLWEKSEALVKERF